MGTTGEGNRQRRDGESRFSDAINPSGPGSQKCTQGAILSKDAVGVDPADATVATSDHSDGAAPANDSTNVDTPTNGGNDPIVECEPLGAAPNPIQWTTKWMVYDATNPMPTPTVQCGCANGTTSWCTRGGSGG